MSGIITSPGAPGGEELAASQDRTVGSRSPGKKQRRGWKPENKVGLWEGVGIADRVSNGAMTKTGP